MEYRLIVLSSAGEPARVETLACTSDVEAAEQASHHATPYGSELWRGERRIGLYPGSMRDPAGAAEAAR
jgi:hypothetical protein